MSALSVSSHLARDICRSIAEIASKPVIMSAGSKPAEKRLLQAHRFGNARYIERHRHLALENGRGIVRR